jgi:hypothetical protein
VAVGGGSKGGGGDSVGGGGDRKGIGSGVGAAMTCLSPSPSPSNCGMSAINCGLLGSWCCRLRLASGTGSDRLVVASALSPAAPAVSFLDAAAFAVATAAL